MLHVTWHPRILHYVSSRKLSIELISCKTTGRSIGLPHSYIDDDDDYALFPGYLSRKGSTTKLCNLFIGPSMECRHNILKTHYIPTIQIDLEVIICCNFPIPIIHGETLLFRMQQPNYGISFPHHVAVLQHNPPLKIVLRLTYSSYNPVFP